MKEAPFDIKRYGPRALLLEWPRKVDPDILMDILSFRDYLAGTRLKEGSWEFVPVYHTLTLIDPTGQADMAAVRRALPAWYASRPRDTPVATQRWELPVCYQAPFGIDLEETAKTLGMDPQELISLHSGRDYLVYGIGFLPGFLYLGGVPQELELPRRAQPRPRVPRGAVGLAGKQTGVYPQQSPGGWHILGNCPVPIFNAEKDPPCLVAPGDRICFRAVSRAEYDLHKIEGEVGIYNYKKGSGHAKGS